jgi:hypothetical protein
MHLTQEEPVAKLESAGYSQVRDICSAVATQLQ